jgi:hypothetical protein
MRTKRWMLGLCAVALTFLLVACGEQTPDGKNDKLVIYEVFTGSASGGLQWVELYNNAAADINLQGWKLVTAKGEIALNGKVTGEVTGNDPATGQPRDPTKFPHGRFVVTTSAAPLIDLAFKEQQDAAADDAARAAIQKLPASRFQEDKTVLGKLDPDNDVIVLKDPSGALVDQVGWGNVSQDVKNSLGITTDTNLGQSSPKGDNISLGRTPNGGVFPTGAPPGIFTIHSTPSPNIGVPKPDSRYNFFLGTFSDIIGAVGGLILWAVFILIALIARRFQVLAEQKTYWEWLIAAPVGIFIYDIILAWNYITEKNITSTIATWSSFGPLFLSGLACLYVINIFRLVAKNILESE